MKRVDSLMNFIEIIIELLTKTIKTNDNLIIDKRLHQL